MTVQAVANRYAQAIFEIGLETGEFAPLLGGLGSFSQALEAGPELRRTLEDPLLPHGEKRALVLAVGERLGLVPTASRALLLLVTRHRLGALSAIVRRLGVLKDRHEGIVRARVTSAQPLPDSFTARLRERLQHELRRRVEIEFAIDPALLAGVVVCLGDSTYDGSLRGRLAELERRLLATA